METIRVSSPKTEPQPFRWFSHWHPSLSGDKCWGQKCSFINSLLKDTVIRYHVLFGVKWWITKKKRWSSSPFIYDCRPSHPPIQHTFHTKFGASHQDPLTVRPGFSIGLCQGGSSEVPTIQSLQLLLAKITPSHQHGKSHGGVVHMDTKYAGFWIGLKCFSCPWFLIFEAIITVPVAVGPLKRSTGVSADLPNMASPSHSTH